MPCVKNGGGGQLESNGTDMVVAVALQITPIGTKEHTEAVGMPGCITSVTSAPPIAPPTPVGTRPADPAGILAVTFTRPEFPNMLLCATDADWATRGVCTVLAR